MVFIEDSLLAQSLILGILFLTFISFLAGYIDSIAGGAGLVLIPAFIVSGIPPHVALGQEKLVSTVGTLAAIKNFSKSDSIIWRIIPLGAVTALVGAYIGAKLIIRLPLEILTYLIICLLPIGLIMTLLKSRLARMDNQHQNISISKLLLMTVCFFVGFYDGFFGPGTGSLFIIALFLINKLPLLQATATSKIFNFTSNIGAFISFFIAGKMWIMIGIPMIFASFLGNHLGSKYAIKTQGQAVKKVLIITVMFMITTLIFQIR